MSDSRSSEDEGTEFEQVPIPVVWRHTPALFIDGVVGIASADGISRVTLGQVSFNPMPNAAAPLLSPVCGLILTLSGIESLISGLQDARKQLTGDQ